MDGPLKVMAYIVREDRLLVFTHADDATPFESGLQVPAGSVRPGDGKGEPIRFELFWVPLRKAHVLAAGQSALLGRLFD